MRINYIAYFMPFDGYGRFNERLVRALTKEGIEIKLATQTHYTMSPWLLKQDGLSWDDMTISALPPYLVDKVPGRHWVLTMTEGTVVPPSWIENLNRVAPERVVVPSQHNADAFRNSGLNAPISVVPGGTDPKEFPDLSYAGTHRPYTFLAFMDRGERKGWTEVWDSFYLAFGGKTTGKQDVRLILKQRPKGEYGHAEQQSKVIDHDQRIMYDISDPTDVSHIYRQADCVALPSRSEGWGMMPREAAMMGLPVITQKHSGMDDGHTEKWAYIAKSRQAEPIPRENKLQIGEWWRADKQSLAERMYHCYCNPVTARLFGREARKWLSQNQTWQHSAQKLIKVIGESLGKESESRIQMECPTIPYLRGVAD